MTIKPAIIISLPVRVLTFPLYSLRLRSLSVRLTPLQSLRCILILKTQLEEIMSDELRAWLPDIAPEKLESLQTLGLVIVALLGGHFLGAMVERTLRAKKFDVALRLPGSSPGGTEPEHGITPTFIAGLLVRLTIWVGVAWWFANRTTRLNSPIRWCFCSSGLGRLLPCSPPLWPLAVCWRAA